MGLAKTRRFKVISLCLVGAVGATALGFWYRGRRPKFDVAKVDVEVIGLPRGEGPVTSLSLSVTNRNPSAIRIVGSIMPAGSATFLPLLPFIVPGADQRTGQPIVSSMSVGFPPSGYPGPVVLDIAEESLSDQIKRHANWLPSAWLKWLPQGAVARRLEFTHRDDTGRYSTEISPTLGPWWLQSNPAGAPGQPSPPIPLAPEKRSVPSGR